jgi:hypothetical protein
LADLLVNGCKFFGGEDVEATLLAAGDNNAVTKLIAELSGKDQTAFFVQLGRVCTK